MLLAALALAASTTSTRPSSPWNGDWVLAATRSSPEAKDGAAVDYRFHIAGRTIRWEIPSLREVVIGRLDGRPMAIRRAEGETPGMTLSVRAEGPGVLVYTVALHGKALGGGRMTLVDRGSAWVDLTRDAGSPMWGAVVTYVRR